MAKRIGTISIGLNLGTAQFIADADAANAKIKTFGNSTKQSMAASSAALRELEGNFANNNRAIARFLATTVGLGPALQAAFPLVGAAAFGTMVVELGAKVYNFFKAAQEGPSKIAAAFRDLTDPIRLSNAEMQVANDKLENEIAKLEGKRQNNLKVALDEAIVSAEKLSQSLNKDVTALYKLLKEQDPGWMAKFFGQGGTSDLAKEIGGVTGFGGFNGVLRNLERDGLAKIKAIKDPKLQEEAAKVLDSQLLEAIAQERAKVDKRLADLKKPTYGREGQNQVFNEDTVQVQGIFGSQEWLDAQTARIKDAAQNRVDIAKKTALEIAKENNKKTDQPFEERMKALNAELEQSRLKLAAIGKSEAEQVQAKAAGEALKIIAEVNRALEKQHEMNARVQQSLRPDQEASIKAITAAKDKIDAESAWKAKLDETTKKIGDQIKGQEMLTAAIGQGYEAVKKANVEIQLMQAVGAERYNDQANAADLAILRQKMSADYDAKNAEQSARKVDALSDQIELERMLAKVQMEGAEAVRYTTLQFEIAKRTKDGASAAEIKALRDEYEARRQNESAAGVSKIEERVAGIRRVIAAQIEGAEAVRKAQLASKYAEMEREGKSPAEIQSQRQADDLEHEEQIRAKALERGRAYKDQLETLRQESAELDKIQVTDKNAFEIELARRSIERERLQILVQETLAHRSAVDGVRAFFIEMQQQAKSAAEIVYETLTSALDQVSDQFAKLFTGQKTNFRKMVQGLGEELLRSTAKSGLQAGLGAIGKKIGGRAGGVLSKIAGVGKMDGSDKAHALWVQLATAAAADKPGLPGPDGSEANPFYVIAMATGAGSAAPSSGDASGSFLGSLFGTLAGAATGSLQARAGGGPVSPGSAYLVGENGPEILTGASGNILSNSESRRLAGGGDTHLYQIDARGADAVAVENRVRTAIIQAHNSAVGTSVQVSADRVRRMPGGK